MKDDLEVLEPAGSSVTYRGEVVDVRPLPIGRIPALVRAARPVIDAVLELDAVPAEDDPAIVTLLLDLISNHGDQVFAAAAICVNKPDEWIREGAIDEFILLAQKVVEVNRDFFVQKLAPLLGGRAALVAKALAANGVGPTSLSS